MTKLKSGPIIRLDKVVPNISEFDSEYLELISEAKDDQRYISPVKLRASGDLTHFVEKSIA